MKYIWIVSYYYQSPGEKHSLEMLFASLELVKQSIEMSYSKWTVKPVVTVERDDYIAFSPADGSLIEAFRKPVNEQPEHL
jgi:hypothetical protein